MKRKGNTGRLISVITACLILGVLTAGLLKTVFDPTDVIYYENRPAEKLRAFSAEEYLNGEFQNSVEDALADQVHFAIKSKKLYNIMDYLAAKPVIRALRKSYSGYIPYRNINFYADALVVAPGSLEKDYWRLKYQAGVFNAWFEACPDTDFYIYYIEHDPDIDFVSGEKAGFFDCFADMLELDGSRISAMTIDSFEQYSKFFLKTDHHWNGRGADRGLREICAMLGTEAPKKTGEAIVHGSYLGTRAAGIEGLPGEDFMAELYDLPEMTITANGNLIPDYGAVAQFAAGELETVSYGKVFGSDEAEIVFDTGREGENLLIMGDSYDNALIKPLSAAFAKTYCVDLRAYAQDADGSFDMAGYIAGHDIDKVIFIGAFEYFSGSSM